MSSSPDIIQRIVEQNLGVYEVSESRLREDVSQEAQVASDYRGRLVYELLQNADDAMAGGSARGDRVVFLVTNDELRIANSGRALTDEDVQGLYGLGAGSKVDSSGKRRASIGHKGLGFKSVLEITAEPVVYSRFYSFKLGAHQARALVHDLWRRTGRSPLPPSVPLMRFPVSADENAPQWGAFVADGLNTAFHFPFRSDLGDERPKAIADLLLTLPLTTVLFLKHLESIEVRVERSDLTKSQSWSVTRERFSQSGWIAASGLERSGSYRVEVRSSTDDAAAFLVSHDADVAIGTNRVGLTGPASEGVEFTEVSVATLEPGHVEMPQSWRHLHVFLPTVEQCPYPILVNGAFSTDLSRQQVRVSEERGDYNAHLIREAARLFRVELLPQLHRTGIESVLTVLDRGERQSPEDRTAAGLFHAALCRQPRRLLPTPTRPGAHRMTHGSARRAREDPLGSRESRSGEGTRGGDHEAQGSRAGSVPDRRPSEPSRWAREGLGSHRLRSSLQPTGDPCCRTSTTVERLELRHGCRRPPVTAGSAVASGDEPLLRHRTLR